MRWVFTGFKRVGRSVGVLGGNAFAVTDNPVLLDNPALLDKMVQLVVQQDPSVEPKVAALLLRACLETLTDKPDADAGEVARRCLARFRAADASWVAHAARAAVTVVRAEQRQPAR